MAVPPTAGGHTGGATPVSSPPFPAGPGVPADAVAAGAIGTGPAGDAAVSTFNYPQWQGELFYLTRETSQFFSAIGGMGRGRSLTTKEFVFQLEQGEGPPVANNAKPEGWTPADEGIPFPEQKFGVVEIHQHSIAVTYTREAVTSQIGAGDAARTGALAPNDSPIVSSAGSPLQGAINRKLLKIGRDLNQTAMYGAFNDPADQGPGATLTGSFSAVADATKVRKSQGFFSYLLKGAAVAGQPAGYNAAAGKTAFTTEWTAAATAAAATVDPLHAVVIDRTATTGANTWRDGINSLLTAMFQAETEAPLRVPVLWMNGGTAVEISKEFTNNFGLADRSRTVGGVAVTTLVTSFGTFGIAMDRYMPTNAIALVDMSYLNPVTLPVPGKGVFFTEALAKTGAYERMQIYGEIGFEYGPRSCHGLIVDAK